MRKSLYLAIAIAAFSIAAAYAGEKSGYTITGTVEGAVDGDTVYLQKAQDRQMIVIDKAVIKNGKFTFKGKQDTVVSRYITCQPKDGRLMIDFFLENGDIKVALTKHNDSATGTPNNDTYQAIRSKANEFSKKANDLYSSIHNDTTLTKEQSEARINEIRNLETSYKQLIKDGINKNITNIVGIYLYKQNYYQYDTEENAAILSKIPAQYMMNDSRLVTIKEQVEKQKKTAAGTKFTDFEMKTPEGKAVKLSDYVGKNKIVLVDFWASWCGPCRKEMPNLVELYAQYKDKGLEIVGVSLDQKADDWKMAIKRLNITWPQMSDLKYWKNEGAQLYAVNSIPHIVLIDAEGTIVSRGLHGEELKAKLAELLK